MIKPLILSSDPSEGLPERREIGSEEKRLTGCELLHVKSQLKSWEAVLQLRSATVAPHSFGPPSESPPSGKHSV